MIKIMINHQKSGDIYLNDDLNEDLNAGV